MHNHGAQAYNQVAKAVESPREREAALLIKSAGMLQRVKDEWPEGQLDAALTYNRKLWTIFITSATREDNPLPAQVRQNIANIGIFVMSRTRELTFEPEAKKIDALVQINRQLAAGLRAVPA
ncbi:flagellar biosynthesis regulator FlaF [Devosia sp. 2618]|uniref:flagellar biosynthesis regulator FlaF n=1 Tax=Devosia sp. 2618 TaxID=3156454 RepID=UPI003395E7D5